MLSEIRSKTQVVLGTHSPVRTVGKEVQYSKLESAFATAVYGKFASVSSLLMVLSVYISPMSLLLFLVFREDREQDNVHSLVSPYGVRNDD